MDCVNDESIYLKEYEWSFLLAGLGMTTVFGFWSEESFEAYEKIGENKIIVDLYQKEMIRCEDNQMIVLLPVADFLEIVLESSKCVIVQGSDPEQSIKCCYLAGESVLVVEKSQREIATIRIKKISSQEWIENVISEIEDEDVQIDIILRGSKEDIVYETLIYEEEGLKKYVTIKEKDTEQRIEYQPDMVKHKMKEWLQEGEGE